MFTELEIERIANEPLGRLATVGPDGQPHVVPTSFRLNRELGTIDIGGHRLGASKKFRDIRRSGRAAFVIDGLLSVDPWRPWGIEMRGEAEALDHGGQEVNERFGPQLIRIHPKRIIAWGIDTDPYQAPNARDVG